MCGILAALGLTGNIEVNRRHMLKKSKLLRHRGPDGNGIFVDEAHNAYLCHERLTIIDTSDAGKQPFVHDTGNGKISWTVNSEIYNHAELREKYLKDVKIPSSSDSAVIGYLYEKYGCTNEMIDMLDGIFACVLYDGRTGEFCAFRDPIGICPLYWGRGADGSIWFSSEMKSLDEDCVEFEIFPPGYVYRSTEGELQLWHNRDWRDVSRIPSNPLDLDSIRQTFINAVVKRLMSDVPLGVLLSGGLDSSLVASVASRHLNESKNAYSIKDKLHTFSIGIKGAPDLLAAKKVADFLGTIHHEFNFTVEEGVDAVRDLIWHIESFEQVRAAVPMYLLSRKIKAHGFKVVLSGEGADEMLGGYLYFHKAPSAAELHRETIRKTTRLHKWDVMRANKATFAWGLEARVPYLDKEFLDLIMNIDPVEKMCDINEKPDGIHRRIEKYILRKAFDTPENPYLPQSVLFRQKEQFSDGVGYDWVDGLKDYATEVITDKMWATRATRFPLDPPRTREYYLLRSWFEEQFHSKSALETVPRELSIACSTPEAIEWDPEWKNMHEISGRAIKLHVAAEDTIGEESQGITNAIPIPINGTTSITGGIQEHIGTPTPSPSLEVLT